ncbi:MAG: hypothetical protein RL490_67 [Pseudomonadota bacterium]
MMAGDDIDLELAWLEAIIRMRLAERFGMEPIAPPQLPAHAEDSPLGQMIDASGLGIDERLVLALALAPHFRPQCLDHFLVRNQSTDRIFTDFGGRIDASHAGFLPTGETAAFLLAGEDIPRRIAIMRLFGRDHARLSGLFRLDADRPGLPLLAGLLRAGDDIVARLAMIAPAHPDADADFPARRLETPLEWDDLIVPAEVRDELAMMTAWAVHGRELRDDWQLGRFLRRGFRALFHGPPGTGKTLAATLIGKQTGRPVYRIDLSLIVSKYIGETEKNLGRLFDRAEAADWVLLFDEADALFGKRTSVASAHDRYANQEVSYLLQRIEDFDGTVILASNFVGNIDDAFARRFQASVYFPMPDAPDRRRLWQQMLGDRRRLAADVDLDALADRHALAGGAIGNALRFAALAARRAGRDTMMARDLEQGAVRELRKEGRVL